MKRQVVALAILATTATGAALAYQAVARERDYRVLLARGDAALHDDQSYAAIEAYSGAIALRPQSMLAYVRRGETYRRRADRGDLDAAARDFRKASRLDTSAMRPLEELGDVCYQLQRYDRAIDAYDRCVRLDDRSARVTYKLAMARYQNGDVNGALVAANQAVRLNTTEADPYYLLGICLRQKGRPREAIAAQEQAVRLSAALIPAREELADLYERQGRRTDQLEELQVLAALDRDHVERQVAVGLAHARAHHWDAAVLALSSALERTPDAEPLYRALGEVWLGSALTRGDQVDVSKAREALDRIASSPNATSEVLTLDGRAALLDGDLPAASHALEQATTRFPIDPESLQLYATVSERMGSHEAARRALIQYAAFYPDRPVPIIASPAARPR